MDMGRLAEVLGRRSSRSDVVYAGRMRDVFGRSGLMVWVSGLMVWVAWWYGFLAAVSRRRRQRGPRAQEAAARRTEALDVRVGVFLVGRPAHKERPRRLSAGRRQLARRRLPAEGAAGGSYEQRHSVCGKMSASAFFI